MNKLLSLLLLLFVTHAYAAKQVVNVYAWGGEIPQSAITQFEKETGIKVNFSTYDSNETLFAKLSASKKPTYDVIEPSSYYLDRMRRLGMLKKLTKVNLPNYKNLNQFFLKPSYDPTGEYSIPWFWGITGFFYNDKYYDGKPLQNWQDLWQPLFKDRLVVLDDPRDTFSMALISLGYSANDDNPKHIEQAYQALRKLMPNIKLFTSDTIREVIIDEDAIAGMVWNGDLSAAQQENQHLHFVYPQQGFIIWVDCFAIPKNAPHPENALKFINFMMRADVAKQGAISEGFATANLAAENLLPKNIRSNNLLYPNETILKRGQFQKDVSNEALALYAKYWELLKIEG